MTNVDFLELGYTKVQSYIAENVLNGHSNKEIAAYLSVSERTVKFHLTRIYKKENVKSRAQFMASFLRK